MTKIIIIGAGVMGKIFLSAVLKVYPRAKVVITDTNLAKLKHVKKEFRSVAILSDNRAAAAGASLVILAIKPQSFAEAAKELEGSLSPRSLILSIMAGVSMKKIYRGLGVKKIIRAMPNLGAQIGKSMTVWVTSPQVRNPEKKKIRMLFRVMGQELTVCQEEMVNKATAVSGSGPGFFFFLVESWLEAAQKLGFSLTEAREMIFSTLDASLELLKTGRDPAKLKQQVASRGGTTEAGLKVMAKVGIGKLWPKILQAAYKRAKEISGPNR